MRIDLTWIANRLAVEGAPATASVDVPPRDRGTTASVDRALLGAGET